MGNVIAGEIAQTLPSVVAPLLDVEEVEDARLTTADIEVFVDEGNRGLDITTFPLDFAVRIEAMFFPERASKVQRVSERIKAELQARYPSLRFKFGVRKGSFFLEPEANKPSSLSFKAITHILKLYGPFSRQAKKRS